MKTTKKLLLLICLIVTILALTSCKANDQNTSKAVLFMDDFIQTFKSGDFEKASSMTEDNEFVSFEIAQDPTFTIASQEKAIAMMKELEYSYLSENVTDDTTSLEIEFTIKNLGELFTQGMREAVMKNLEAVDSNLSDEEISAQVGQTFEKAFDQDPKTYKETVIVELKKNDSGYVIVPTGELLNMLMGNLLRAQQEITQALAGVTTE